MSVQGMRDVGAFVTLFWTPVECSVKEMNVVRVADKLIAVKLMRKRADKQES